jgi:ankyrin repeat protein
MLGFISCQSEAKASAPSIPRDPAVDAFFTLCENGSPEEILAAVNGGASLAWRDKDGYTPFMRAVGKNTDLAVTALFLNLGASIDERTPWGLNVLSCAAASNTNPDVIRLLLKNGAKVNETSDDGSSSALGLAAMINKNPDVIMILLQAGANGKIKNSMGNTPYQAALKYNESLKGTPALEALREAQF